MNDTFLLYQIPRHHYPKVLSISNTDDKRNFVLNSEDVSEITKDCINWLFENCHDFDLKFKILSNGSCGILADFSCQEEAMAFKLTWG